MRILLLSASVVALAATPVGATWSSSGTAAGKASTAVLQAVAAPGVVGQCATNGSLGVTVSWSHTGTPVTGYEVYRTTNGATPVRFAQVSASTTQVQDTSAIEVTSTVEYTVRSLAGGWTVTSSKTALTGNRIC